MSTIYICANCGEGKYRKEDLEDRDGTLYCHSCYSDFYRSQVPKPTRREQRLLDLQAKLQIAKNQLKFFQGEVEDIEEQIRDIEILRSLGH